MAKKKARQISLLDKKQRLFFISLMTVLLCSSPLFFLVSKHFYTADVDDTLRYQRDEFVSKYERILTPDKINEWNNYSKDIQILPYDSAFIFDKIFRTTVSDKETGYTADFRTLYHHIKVEDTDYVLMLRQSVMETKDILFTTLSQYGLLLLILIICLLAVERHLSKKLWAPFYDSLNKIENFDLEKGRLPCFVETDIKEFSSLNLKVADLMKNNLTVYAKRKEFIENTSHELQTPLAIFNTKLDLLLQDPDLTPGQIGIIKSLYEASLRLNGMTKSLLLLTKIENDQFTDTEEVNLSELINTQCSYFEGIAEAHNIAIGKILYGGLLIKANKILCESLSNNIITNAIRYNHDGGTIRIVVGEDFFTVSNTGDGFPLDKEKIFKRFGRKEKQKDNNGLGLYIAWQICRLHGWVLDYDYDYAEAMHCFSVQFNPKK